MNWREKFLMMYQKPLKSGILWEQRFTYNLVAAGWHKGLSLEIQTMGTSENICLDFLAVQWGKREKHEVMLKSQCWWELISHLKFYSLQMSTKKPQPQKLQEMDLFRRVVASRRSILLQESEGKYNSMSI